MRPDWHRVLADAGGAELAEIFRLAIERALCLGAVELLDALADTVRAARGDVVGRSWEPTESPPARAPVAP